MVLLTAAEPGTWLPRPVLQELGGGGDALSSWWTVAAVLGVAAGLVVVAARARRARRRRGRGRVVAPAAGAAAALVLGALLATNCLVGYVPDAAAARVTLASWGLATAPRVAHGVPTAHGATATTGEVRSVRIASPAVLRMPHELSWVYTPPGYDPHGATRYPVVYLLHGSPGHAGDWFAAGQAARTMDVLLAHHLVAPAIVVSPDVNGTGRSARDTECLDSTRGGSRVATYLGDVVVPWVDAHYATVPDREHRTIGGMSMGAYCALDQGLHHPGLFGAILAIGPYGDPGSGGRAMLASHAQWVAHAPSRYLPTIALPDPVPTFLDVGTVASGEDARVARSLAAQLRARGQLVVDRSEAGQGHTWRLARAALPYALVFASAHTGGPAAS